MELFIWPLFPGSKIYWNNQCQDEEIGKTWTETIAFRMIGWLGKWGRQTEKQVMVRVTNKKPDPFRKGFPEKHQEFGRRGSGSSLGRNQSWEAAGRQLKELRETSQVLLLGIGALEWSRSVETSKEFFCCCPRQVLNFSSLTNWKEMLAKISFFSIITLKLKWDKSWLWKVSLSETFVSNISCTCDLRASGSKRSQVSKTAL